MSYKKTTYTKYVTDSKNDRQIMSKLFINNDLKIETQWRSLILFGKNSATYKFAFAQSLLELANNEKTVIKIEDLVIPFALHTVNHLRQNNYMN